MQFELKLSPGDFDDLLASRNIRNFQQNFLERN